MLTFLVRFRRAECWQPLPPSTSMINHDKVTYVYVYIQSTRLWICVKFSIYSLEVLGSL